MRYLKIMWRSFLRTFMRGFGWPFGFVAVIYALKWLGAFPEIFNRLN